MVTVCVLSYNSQSTILETLDSIYSQKYQNIELIISDDGSKDNTVPKVKDWIEKNGDRFIRTELITVIHNTGVPANCNRAVAYAHGDWVKFIAADDILMSNCIADNVKYITDHPYSRIFYTNYYNFVVNNGQKILNESDATDKFNEMFDVEPSLQLKIYLTIGPNITPSLFINKKLIGDLGGFNEKYRLFEDVPFLTKVLKNGIKIYHSSQYTVLYRKDNTSITRGKVGKHYYNNMFNHDRLLFHKNEAHSIFKWYDFKYWLPESNRMALYYFAIKILKNKRTLVNDIIFKIYKIFLPYHTYIWLKSKLSNFILRS